MVQTSNPNLKIPKKEVALGSYDQYSDN